MDRNDKTGRAYIRIWGALAVLVSLGFLISGIYYFKVEKKRIRSESYNDLASVAALKVRGLEQWRLERLSDVEILADVPFVRSAVTAMVHKSGDSKEIAKLAVLLRAEKHGSLYSEEFIVANDGHTLISAHRTSPRIHHSEMKYFLKVLDGQGATITDFFRASDGKIYIDALNAVLDQEGRPAGVIVLRSGANEFLYPLLDTWPVASRSAETLLIEKHADSIEILNNPRLHDVKALSAWSPVDSVSAPAKQMVLGKIGMVEGTDYRGTRVLANIQPVPNTPWTMVTKVDASEISDELDYRARVVAILVILLVTLSAAGVAFVHRRQQARVYREKYEAEAKRRDLQDEYRATLYSIGDGVITTDNHLAVRGMNHVAESLTGWTEKEAFGKHLGDIFRIEKEEGGTPVENPVRHVLESGAVAEFTNHSRLVSKKGWTCPIAFTAAPIKGNSEAPRGVVLVFRDQTRDREAERRLRESESELRRSQRVSLVGYYNLDIGATKWTGSEMLDEIFGIDSSYEHDIDGWTRLIHPHDRERMVAYFRNEVLAQGKRFDNEYRVIRVIDKREIWVHEIGDLDFGDNGNPVRMFGTVQDITDRRAAAGISERLVSIVESSDDAIIGETLDGIITNWNRGAGKMFGFSSDEMVGKPIWMIAPPERKDEIIQTLRRVKSGEHIKHFETVRQKKTGETIDVSLTVSPILNSDGTVYAASVVAHDITEQKKVMDSLDKSEKKFRAFVEGSSSAIWIHDGAKYLYANPAALEMTGYGIDEYQQLSLLDIVPPELRDTLQKRVAGRMNGEDHPSHFELQIVTKSGRTKWIDFSAAPIEFNGLRAILGSAFDISDRKKLEDELAQAQKMDGIGRLAGGIAHDYNNMLGVIIGYSQLLLQTTGRDDRSYRYVESIGAAAQRGADLTRRLLAFARKEIVSPVPIDANKAIASLQKILSKLIGEEVNLNFLPGSNIWKTKIDPTQFDQIVMNLVTNARDAISGMGTVVLETFNVVLDAEYSSSRVGVVPGEYLMLSVSDDGKGMDPDMTDKIFEPFFTTKEKGQGTGLGLSTVYGIVKQNGGSISVFSEPGHGTRFEIYLPRYEGDYEEEATESNACDLSGNETLLVVEDQAELLELARRGLEEYGYRVLTALTPLEGLSIAENYQGEIHLLLTDVIMPAMNGKELRDRISERRPTIRTLFMSGYTADIIAHRGVLDKDVDFIQKPFVLANLSRKVREILNV